jgi:hypothetical protein
VRLLLPWEVGAVHASSYERARVCFCLRRVGEPSVGRLAKSGPSMISRTLSGVAVLAMAAVLSGVVVGHLWERYTEETAALGFSGMYERYLASQAGFGDDAQGYRAALHTARVQEASALEE